MQIIGCYAQTELHYGSSVQGLQITVTFYPQTIIVVTRIWMTKEV
ncbi:putative acyl-CoA dehydrogenase/oxidase and middle domain superfamily [Helianthus debilis subsp. tardiflorus]